MTDERKEELERFIAAWAIWIPLEGRAAFIEQLKKLVEQTDDY